MSCAIVGPARRDITRPPSLLTSGPCGGMGLPGVSGSTMGSSSQHANHLNDVTEGKFIIMKGDERGGWGEVGGGGVRGEGEGGG